MPDFSLMVTAANDLCGDRMLTPRDEDLQKIHDLALKLGLLNKPVPMSDLIDRGLLPADIKPADIKPTDIK